MFLADPEPCYAEWPVDAADPVNRAHPLNQGRRLWLLSAPPANGGRNWYDLIGTNVATAGGASTGWSTVSRPGGNGSIVLPGGGSSWGLSGPVNTYTAGAAMTVAVWFRTIYVNTTTQYGIIGQETFNTAGWVLMDNLGAAGTVIFRVNGTPGNYAQVSHASLTDSKFHRIVGIYTGSGSHTVQIYLDGVFIQQNTGAGTAGATTNAITIGSASASVSNVWLDDVTIWNRVLSGSEVWADYDLSRRGYPGVLNRLAPAGAFLGTGPAPAGTGCILTGVGGGSAHIIG